jgi:hypothetical protein
MKANAYDYLEQEIASAERGFKTGAIALVVIAIILVVYFQWLKARVTEMTEPGNIAALVESELRRSIPDVRDSMKTSLKRSAPELIAFVADTVVGNTVPMLRAAVEKLFKDYSRELVLLGVEATEKIFEQLIKENKDALRLRISAAPGMFTTERLVDDLDAMIQRELATRLNTEPEETVGFKLNQSLVALRNINSRLQEMASQRNLSRKDLLGKKLITTWWTLLQNLEPDKTAAEKMLDARMKPLSPESIEQRKKGD